MNGNLFDGAAPSAADGQDQWFTAHCDGGSRGNPGPSAYGAVIEDPGGQVAARLSAFLGVQTNNYAEYAGLLAALKWAVENGVRCLRVVSDSELMVKQMKGTYRVSSPGLRPLWEEARQLARKLDGFQMRHTLRAGNKEADRLANEAMDKGMGKGREQGIGIREQGRGSREEGIGNRNQGTKSSDQRHTGDLARGKPEPAKSQRQVLEGYVKNGVVHILEGELPEGIFVKVVRE
jgi:probable phosphoglycerate mutase